MSLIIPGAEGPKPNIDPTVDPIDTARLLQGNIPPWLSEADKRIATYQALEMLGHPKDINGSADLIMHALGAVVIPENSKPTDIAAALSGGVFGEVSLRGHFVRFAFGPQLEEYGLSVRLSDVTILDAVKPEDGFFVGSKFPDNFYVPVKDLTLAIPAK